MQHFRNKNGVAAVVGQFRLCSALSLSVASISANWPIKMHERRAKYGADRLLENAAFD
jgi:hypothetical protein